MSQEHNHSHDSYLKLLEGNKKFVEEKLAEDPEFFSKRSKGQQPKYLLIGCSDSRVPPDQLTKTQPGEIFIHRNVANVVIPTDMNAMSVLQYAVQVLKVEHVIVMGHTKCGGVRAAMTNQSFGLIDTWLSHIKNVYRIHKQELEKIEDEDARADKLVEFNVKEQVINLCKSPIIQQAWGEGSQVKVHGWICDIETGLVKEVDTIDNWNAVKDVFKLNFKA